MAHVNKVMRSVNTDDGAHCVDVFVRPDGTYGFEEYRRDVEDGRGWFAVGRFSAGSFASEQAAWDAACAAVTWLNAAAEL